MISKINAKVNIPFAGKYMLGGRLAYLNDYRGVADPVEILEIDSRACVLADGGGKISTLDLLPSGTRVKKYLDSDVRDRIQEIKEKKMDYERLIAESEISQLPLKRLLFSAVRNAIKKSECDEDYFFCINLPNGEWAVINANSKNSDGIKYIFEINNLPEPRSEILIDSRYLFGLLVNIYHWNNAEVGSQYYVRRFPNIFNRKAQSFLNYLAV